MQVYNTFRVTYMTTNRVSAILNPDDRQVVINAIATIKQAMPFLVYLTKEDRKTMPKVSDRGREFMLNCLDAANQHTDCLPRTFDVAEMQKDVQLLEDLYPIVMALTALQNLVDDAYFAAHSEAYVTSLKVYDAMKSHGDMPGMQITLEQLKQQFARCNKRESAESNAGVASVPVA